MKKTYLTGLLAGLAAAATASAQEGRLARVAVVDTARVSAESLMGKSYAARIEKLNTDISALMTEKQTELGRMDTAIRDLQEELEKQAAVLSVEARDKKQQEITRKTRERNAFLEDGQLEVNRARERAAQQAQSINNEFQNRVRPLVEEAARELGYDIVVERTVTVFAAGTHDITAQVIAKADAAETAKPAADSSATTEP